jgi:probable addiction module antidote protein
MAITTRPFDAAKYLIEETDQIDLIIDALDTGNAGYIAAALGTIARARGMSTVAGETGLSRQSLYTALSATGNPTLETVLKVLDALGLKLTAKVREAA